MTIHATAVALMTASGWRAVLLRGPSGAGKSDLALRLLGRGGWQMIADDRVHLWRSGASLYVAPVERLAGALEARGIGLMDVPFRPLARLGLIADCGEPAERLPDPLSEVIEGVAVPVVALDARAPSAPDKLRLALCGRDALSRLEP
ncbi:HPr kinase/phosphorylase [Brevundimonas aveniformis]|uniref:HPr kinase/phosphorylase n=1 Tax=Brevundimonas aveniformis TaxID=370977 RepID=UPI0024917CB1|nr:serine kinase [Brevundimonas aveniformis]